MFQVPEHIRPIRDRVRRFIDDEIIPHETELDTGEPGKRPLVEELIAKAKAEGLWALGHAREFRGIGGLVHAASLIRARATRHRDARR